MSRSYKKTPYCCDRNPWAKKQANKKVRRTNNLSSGRSYRKIYQSWNISDWKFTSTFSEYWAIECRLGDRYGSQKTYMEAKNEWEKHHIRK